MGSPPLLAIFILGLFAPKVSHVGAVVGLLAGQGVSLWLLLPPILSPPPSPVPVHLPGSSSTRGLVHLPTREPHPTLQVLGTRAQPTTAGQALPSLRLSSGQDPQPSPCPDRRALTRPASTLAALTTSQLVLVIRAT